MFKRIFKKSSKKQETSALKTIEQLNGTLELLEKKENLLVKKASAELEKAKECSKAKTKNAALQCLKKKKMYEKQIEKLATFQLRIHDQIIMLEGAEVTTETVDALRTGAGTMKAMLKETHIKDLDGTLDEINEQTESMRQIQDSLSAPFGAAADFDEDELEAELEELEQADLETELVEPATTAPAYPSHVPVAARPSQVKNAPVEDDLAASLQAELVL